MADTLHLLKALIPELERFAQTTTAAELPDFVAWLHQRHAPRPAAPDHAPVLQEPPYLNALSPRLQLLPLVVRLNYFTHAAIERLFADLPVPALREFSVLGVAANNGAPTKSEIAATALLEFSTVTEVTRRLVKAGLLLEVTDPQDRRARRLPITETGQRVYQEARERLEQLTKQLYDPLTQADQLELRRLLSILNAVHSKHLITPGTGE